ARALAAQPRAEDARQPDRAVRGEELRRGVRAAPGGARAAAADGRRDPRVRGDRDAGGAAADRREASVLAARTLVPPGDRGRVGWPAGQWAAQADPLVRAVLAAALRRAAATASQQVRLRSARARVLGHRLRGPAVFGPRHAAGA